MCANFISTEHSTGQVHMDGVAGEGREHSRDSNPGFLALRLLDTQAVSWQLPQVQPSLHGTSFLRPRWRQTACRRRKGGWQNPSSSSTSDHPGGAHGVHLRPHRHPPTQPSAGLLISHPVPPAPSCLSRGGLRPGTNPGWLNQNKS